jgi:DNA-binding MarR family transcriptional regulator
LGIALDQALHHVYRAGAITMAELAAQCSLSVSRVSRLITRAEGCR